MDMHEKLTEEEQVKALIKKLTRVILILILVTVIVFGAVVCYFINKYSKERSFPPKGNPAVEVEGNVPNTEK